MKAAFFEGNKKISVRDIPEPLPGDGEVLVKIESAALCGSDMKHFFADKPHTLVEGHENAGVIVESRSSKWKKGDRIVSYAVRGCGKCDACRTGNRIFCSEIDYILGGFSEYIIVPEENCLPLPDFMDYKGGSVFCDCLGLSFHTLQRLGVNKGDLALIIGAGPVGLGMILMAKHMGLQTIVVDINSYRLNLAEELGVNNKINSSLTSIDEAMLEATKGKSPDFTIDCAGKEATQLECMKLCKKGGSVAFVAGNSNLSFNPNEFFLTKELTVLGNWYFNFHQYDEIINIIKGKIDPNKLVTDSFVFDDVQKAFDLFASGNCGKVVLTP